MHYVAPNKPMLLLWCRISLGIASETRGGMMVVVTPFSEVVCELHPRRIGVGVLKVDNDELFVLIGGV